MSPSRSTRMGESWRLLTPTMMSMTGFAARSGTAVLPTCSISSTKGPMARSMLIRSSSKSVGQRGSYGTTRTGSSAPLAIRAGLIAEEIQAASPGKGSGPVSGPELAVDVVRVGLDRAHGDEEVPCDLRVGPAQGEAAQHFDLALAQGLVELLELARGAFAPSLE